MSAIIRDLRKLAKQIYAITEQELIDATPQKRAEYWFQAMMKYVTEDEKRKGLEMTQHIQKIFKLMQLFKKNPEMTFEEGMNKIFGDYAWPEWLEETLEELP